MYLFCTQQRALSHVMGHVDTLPCLMSTVKMKSSDVIDDWLIEAVWRKNAPVNWPSLVQIMDRHLFGTKSLVKTMLECWSLTNKLQWNLNQKVCMFSQENSFGDIVWKVADILSRPQCVNSWDGTPLGDFWWYRYTCTLALVSWQYFYNWRHSIPWQVFLNICSFICLKINTFRIPVVNFSLIWCISAACSQV